MDIRAFAEQYRLRINDKKLTGKYRIRMHAQPVVYGRYGEIDEDKTYGDVFVVRFLAVPRDAVMTGALRNRRKKALGAGLRCKWLGHDESSFHFDPCNDVQAKLVIALVGAPIRRRRILSDEQRRLLVDRLRKLRNTPALEKTCV
jgi:hypothetical protein